MATHARSRKALGLWMNGHFVGTWSLEAGGDVLQYDSQWVQSPQRRPLSLSLPFTPGNRPHKGDAVRFYFENLLPDSKDIRERVARRYQVGATDAYTLLREVGRDCVGALQILPAGDEPPTDLRVQAEPMSDHAVAQRIRTLAQPGAFGDAGMADDFRISIAGAQEKDALLFWQGRYTHHPHLQTASRADRQPATGHAAFGRKRMALRPTAGRLWLASGVVRNIAF